jgi:NAD(P)-dependent dehydrogenase (short-subunit alcohol dehydrogenase family)
MKGQSVVVTGAAAGLGQHLALAFAREGARLVVIDRVSADDTVAELRALGGNADAFRCDISQETQVVETMKEVGALLGGHVDVLVNNAGTNGRVHLVRDMDLSDWSETLGINLTGTMLVTRESIPYLVKSGSGRIVNIASNVARRGLPLRGDYVASKWALLGLTQTLALELVDDGIRVNAICPGPVEGDRIEQILRMHAEAEGVDVPTMRAAWEDVPMGRFVTADEVAAVALFLASDASSAMTGQALNVTGGFLMT